ncbi:MAG: hypothetical protein RIC16_03845 [Rhodospirillales bacterium]
MTTNLKPASDDEDAVWALGIDLGPSGKLSPLTLIADATEALSVRRMLERTHGPCVYCVRVPFWPGLRIATEDGDQS